MFLYAFFVHNLNNTLQHIVLLFFVSLFDSIVFHSFNECQKLGTVKK